ncbi:MAG: hypothetical protein OXH52_06405 [Gammaproteobacteria bacterium]|nr:hypothetical protein [Gammaproteobacteria bacterium]
MTDAATPPKAVRAAAVTAVLILALGAGVFVLWDEPNSGAVDVVPLSGGDVHLREDHIEPVPDRLSPVVSPTPGAPVDTIVADPVLPDSDDGPWIDGGVIDTGPFIDADNDTGTHVSGPVSDVGDFLDPEAG